MSLIDKINDKSAKIGVIGLGYVGLPLAIEFTNAGYNVTGVDVDQRKVDLINSGKNYISDVKDSLLNEAVNKKLLTATTKFSTVKNLDAISICVPTPLNKEKSCHLDEAHQSCPCTNAAILKARVSPCR